MSGIVAFYIPDWLGGFQECIRWSRESRMMRGRTVSGKADHPSQSPTPYPVL